MSTTRRRGGSTTEAPRPLGAGCSAPFFPSGDGAAHKRRLSIVLRPDPQIPFSPPAVGGNWKDREGRRRDGGRGRPLGRVSRPRGQPVSYLQPSCPALSPPSSPPPPKLLPPAASPAEHVRGPRSHRAASSPRSQLAGLPRVASPKKKKKPKTAEAAKTPPRVSVARAAFSSGCHAGVTPLRAPTGGKKRIKTTKKIPNSSNARRYVRVASSNSCKTYFSFF